MNAATGFCATSTASGKAMTKASAIENKLSFSVSAVCCQNVFCGSVMNCSICRMVSIARPPSSQKRCRRRAALMRWPSTGRGDLAAAAQRRLDGEQEQVGKDSKCADKDGAGGDKV